MRKYLDLKIKEFLNIFKHMDLHKMCAQAAQSPAAPEPSGTRQRPGGAAIFFEQQPYISENTKFPSWHVKVKCHEGNPFTKALFSDKIKRNVGSQPVL